MLAVMPTRLGLAQHLDATCRAALRLAGLAEESGLDAEVPTCPSWDVRSLVAHQAMVHRWATAQVTGGDPDAVANQTTMRERSDLLDHFREGAEGIVAALATAPEDLSAMTFLNDAPAPREFWARRQAHETTIHMVDALAARLARIPEASETGIDADLAADGLDELLRGFFTRGRSKLFDGVPRVIAVVPADVPEPFVLRVADPPGSADPADADLTLSGSSVQLYLGLWNRGAEIQADGDRGLLDRWREVQRVRWS
jgi:uncharacterized protein (TIGR03083 family)